MARPKYTSHHEPGGAGGAGTKMQLLERLSQCSSKLVVSRSICHDWNTSVNSYEKIPAANAEVDSSERGGC
jgi:hypothetical protein